MAKRCIICEALAQYVIKGSSDFYCEQCAREHFGDLSLLIALEESAQLLKAYVESHDEPDVAIHIEVEDEEDE